MTDIADMTLVDCIKAKVKEEKILDQMLKIPNPGPLMIGQILEQEKKLESLEYWITLKPDLEASE
jgi:hypothetical protein